MTKRPLIGEKRMEVIHFSTNNIVGRNLSADEMNNGDLLLIRTRQTANPDKAKPPETFVVSSEERHGLMEYLNSHPE